MRAFWRGVGWGMWFGLVDRVRMKTRNIRG